MSLWPGF